jgi:shikimate O-hydroxycinnamoyltransferase
LKVEGALPLAGTDPLTLSPIDHLFIGHVMPLVLHYPERLDAQRLVASLEEVLKAIPLLAGGLVEREDGRYGAGPPIRAVERLEVREVPALPEELDGPLALREWVPQLSTGPGQPLLAARLTLAPRASILALTVSHAVMDGFGIFMFMRAWSRAAAGRPFEALPTDRSLLAVEVPEPAAPLTPEEVWRRTGFTWRPGHRRTLDAPQPTAFGTRLVPPDGRALAGDEPLSDNDVLCAWLIKTHGAALAGRQGLAVALPIEYRQSHGGLPRHYLGNAVRAAPLWLPREVIERESIPELAARVQQATRSGLDGRAARDSLACLEQLLREQGPHVLSELHLADPTQGFLVTNISHLPFGVLELGEGPPTWARLPALEERTAAIEQAGEGLEVSLLLPPASAPA